LKTSITNLLDWYHSNARDLPWRHTTDPYHIWISEIMLQQTQVKTVLPRYAAWFEVFPSIKALADAHIDDVFKQWEGLGYYRRARFIHEAAQHITAQFNGQFPCDFKDILSLKGIGKSTAGAISSFCFNTYTPVLDGNVKRVLSAWKNKDLNEKELWQFAQNYIEHSKKAGLWNQAMMELGATLCQARKRVCDKCPMTSTCQSAFTEPPKKVSTLTVKDVYWQVSVHQHEQHGIWLEQRPQNGIWSGLWTPPIIELDTKPKHQPNLVHQLSHRRIHLYLKDEQSTPIGNGKWFTSWEGLAVPTGIHRLFEQRSQ